MEDVLAVYERPYDPLEPVICLDEKPLQLLGDIYPVTLPKPGKAATQDYEYKRKGTCCLFVAIEPKGKRRFVKARKRRTRKDFAYFTKGLLDKYPKVRIIHLVSDNLNTHNEKSFYETFEEEKAKELLSRIQFHHTPKHASWLNAVEIEIGVLECQCLKRRLPTIKVVRKEVKAWAKRRNKLGKGINWKFTKEKAKVKFPELYIQKLGK